MYGRKVCRIDYLYIAPGNLFVLPATKCPKFRGLGEETKCQVFQDRLENVRERHLDARCEIPKCYAIPIAPANAIITRSC